MTATLGAVLRDLRDPEVGRVTIDVLYKADDFDASDTLLNGWGPGSRFTKDNVHLPCSPIPMHDSDLRRGKGPFILTI